MFVDLGPTRIVGEKTQPTDWPTIHPFGEAMGLDSDDKLTLFKMCKGYYDALLEGENPLSISPVDREQT